MILYLLQCFCVGFDELVNPSPNNRLEEVSRKGEALTHSLVVRGQLGSEPVHWDLVVIIEVLQHSHHLVDRLNVLISEFACLLVLYKLMLWRRRRTKVNCQQQVQMSPIDDVGDEGIPHNLLELADQDMPNDECILVHLVVVLLVFVDILNVYLLCGPYLHFCLGIAGLEHLNPEPPSLLLWDLVGGDFEWGELDLSMIALALCLVDGHPLSTLEYLHLQEYLVLVHEVVGCELDLELSIPTVVFRAHHLEFPLRLVVTLLIDLPGTCPSLYYLPHIHLHNPYPRLLLYLQCLTSINIINMELYVLCLLFIVTQNECFDELRVDLIGNNLCPPYLHQPRLILLITLCFVANNHRIH